MLIYSMEVNIYENEVHSIWVIWTTAFKNQGQPRVGGPEFGFFGVVPARRPNECNAHRGYLETPDESA